MPTATAQTVTTEINFLSPTLKEKPYTYNYNRNETNVITEDERVDITDLRTLTEAELQDFTTETSGFQWTKNESTLKGDDFFDEEKVKSVYYKEVDQYASSKSG